MTLAAVLRAASLELDRQGAAFGLVGGLAVSARAEPRFTRDVDLAVAVVDDVEAEGRIHRLVAGGFSVDTAVEQTATGRLATVRLRPPTDPGMFLDLLFASSGIEPEIVARSEPIEVLPGLTVPVAVTGDLIALKLLARDDKERPQDIADLRALVRIAMPADWLVANQSCQDIAARGFNRGRDLVADAEHLRRSAPHDHR